MKKNGLLLTALLSVMALGFAGCGKDLPQADAAQTEDAVSVTAYFANQTGKDIGILKISPGEDYPWSENLIQEEAWKNNYEIPVMLNGVLPEVEQGWQVQMTFLDGTEQVWTGVQLIEEAVVEFTLVDGVPGVTTTDKTIEEGDVTDTVNQPDTQDGFLVEGEQ